MEVLGRRSWGSFSTVFLLFLNALLHLYTLTFYSVFSPYRLFNLEYISDGIQPSFVRNLIIMRCSTLTLPSLRSSSSQLTKLRSSKHQIGEWPWNSASTFHILLLSTDLPAFLNYEQITIHIYPRLLFIVGVGLSLLCFHANADMFPQAPNC
jgi:hypothetical protein